MIQARKGARPPSRKIQEQAAALHGKSPMLPASHNARLARSCPTSPYLLYPTFPF